MRFVLFFVATGLQIGAVFLGFFSGLRIGFVGWPPSVYTREAGLAGVLMLAGAILSLLTKNAASVKFRNEACVGVLGYSVVIVIFEPFLIKNTDITQEISAALMLVPLLLAIPYLLRAAAWLSAAGVTLFVFTSSSMLTSNTHHLFKESGFFRSFEIRE
jgi:hypothetical protein